MSTEHRCRNLVIGGGIAGIVTALELLNRGQAALLLDRDSEERFGGLALWAFGGMALVGTPEQRRFRIADSPELALEDWVRFGELDSSDRWPRAWAECYVNESRAMVYDWVKSLGLKFMPAVNWVERGSSIKGNSVPRYHLLWGTGRVLVQTLITRLLHHPNREMLTVLHRHRVTALNFSDGVVTGCRGTDESMDERFVVEAANTVIATGGINGSEKQVRRHWPRHWPPAPDTLLNGAHPFADGLIHQAAAEQGACLTHVDEMWNYAAGIPHPQAQFEGHGLSLIPCKTGLWLTPDGSPLGPAPMVTGYDTREMCRQVAAHPYTWQVLNWKIAAKEMAISGSEHNPRILKRQLVRFLLETALGSDRLLRRMVSESAEFVSADDVGGLADKMNRLSGTNLISGRQLEAQVENYDRVMADPELRSRDPAISRIRNLREWPGDKLRTCNMQTIGDRKAGPLLAIRLHFISRKSLGGLKTDLQGRVLNRQGEPLPGLYAVGEAAGFGGGGASGKRSLEGTFLSGCILTARKTAAAICH
ncbi:MAG: FAD-binding dehydrogenase [Xanthomonadales bacterium]|nr:FAD-binding dehydrogenase [Gammaproteobacteria bacterium]NND57654.1 FAD-binding dehydrogenase [Xanthomonadales bacterium]NNK51572.1 FAD-binding dehydrogenase [Xanthomonadales bacterium]